MTDPFADIPSPARGLRADLQAILDRDREDDELALRLLLPRWMGGEADAEPTGQIRLPGWCDEG